MMLGYWKQPELTRTALRGGYIHKGDMGRMDEDGFIYVVDRLKDMIVSGGENVYSVEVEDAVRRHPAVAMCAVIGIPHLVWGRPSTLSWSRARGPRRPPMTSSPTAAR
jgi:long-chain acyl-CoA synthetase